MPARQTVIYFSILLLLFTACKNRENTPRAPSLIRLEELFMNPKTEINSHFRVNPDDFQQHSGNGWKVEPKQIVALERRTTFLLPEWLWKTRDFRMKFVARSQSPRDFAINVQGQELATYKLTKDWKEYTLHFQSKDLKKRTVKQLQFLFGGEEASPYAEFQFFQLPLYHSARTDLGKEVRTGFSVSSNSNVKFHLRLPSGNPALFFGIGVPVDEEEVSEITYTVRIRSGRKSKDLIRKTVKFSFENLRWQDETIPLGDWAGKEVTLELESQSSAAQDRYVTWSSPELYDLKAKSDKPNIILLSIDTMRADRFSNRTSPNLVEFAKKSIVFDNAYCTFPSTLPSHTSVMTGLYVGHHQVSRPVDEIVRVKQIPPQLTTIAEMAQQAKYFTAGITDGGFVSKFFGFDRGFHQYSENIHMARKDVATIANAVTWLNKNSQRPFFLFLHSYEVHEPFNPPPEVFRKLFPKPALDQQPVITMDLLHRIVKGDIVPKESQKEFIRQCYDAEVYFFDQNFATLLNELKRLKLDQNTVILIFADHGEQFFDRENSFGHGKTLAPEEIRVPLILHIPGKKPEQRKDLVSLVDIYPTVANLMGIKPAARGDGINLLEPANSKQRFNRPIFYEVTYGKEARWGAQTHEFKLVLDKQKGTESFYDLRKDPEERNDLGKTESRSLKQMKQLLASYVQKSTSPTGWAKTKQQKQETNELKEQLKALGYIN